ncbi:hypothetical protein ABT261_04335, partial [Amycolatopsis sp. NPDC000740]
MSDRPEPADTDVATGPVRVPAQYGGLLERGFDEVPTPPAGTGVVPAHSRPPVGSPRTDRESVLALFAVHMFPLGHLPVAADRPDRQLPLPSGGDTEGARRPLFDHPESALLDDTAVLG